VLSCNRRIRRGHRLLGLAGRLLGPEFHNAHSRWCSERPATSVRVVCDTPWDEPPDHGAATAVSTVGNASRGTPGNRRQHVLSTLSCPHHRRSRPGGCDDSDGEVIAHSCSTRVGSPR
jgi:hypothetical protein